jgi:L-iditol 2-dehydrogenase
MRALELSDTRSFSFKEMAVPDFGPDEVLVKVEACGICGSDVHGIDGSTGRRIPPVVMGHEAAGRIAAAGARVGEDWRPGDRVTFDSTIYCGECFYCRRGEINLCTSRRVLGVSCDEYRQNGAFAEYVAVPARSLYRLPEEVSMRQAAMVEPLSIAVHAAEITPISVGDTALIFGAGVIGLLLLQVLRRAGCGTLYVADLDPQRLKLAEELGAHGVFIPGEIEVPEAMSAATAGLGVDLVFDAVGLPATFRDGFASLRKGGQFTVIGNFSPTAELPLQYLVNRQITLRGSCASAGEYPACLELIRRGAVEVERLISRSAPLSEGAAWFERLYRGDAGLLKVILLPGEGEGREQQEAKGADS